MKSRLTITAGLLAALAAISLPWPRDEGDAAAGAQTIPMRQGWRVRPGVRMAYPEVYSVPKLGGQHAAYLVNALKAYKSGDRAHPTMMAIAASLSDQDMADVAAYYSQQGR